MKQITNGRLTVVMTDDFSDDVQRAIDTVKAEIAEGACKLPLDVCEAEIHRLAGLAQVVMIDDGLFRYLPLTKQNKFPTDAKILVASSKVRYGARCDGYVESGTLQLRLVPAYANSADWMAGKRMEDTRILSLGFFQSSSTVPPIYGEDGIPSKPAVTRATYLKDDQVVPGRVYEDKKGAKYLVITGIPMSVKCWNHGLPWCGGKPYLYVPFDPGCYHAYVRWTDDLAKALGTGGTASWNDLVKFLVAKGKYGDWFESASKRENPRKFVKEVCVAVNTSKTVREDIWKKDCPDQYNQGLLTDYRYRLHPEPGFFGKVHYGRFSDETTIDGEED